MFENTFLKFSTTIAECTEQPIPINQMSDLAFFYPLAYTSSGLVDVEGNGIAGLADATQFYDGTTWFFIHYSGDVPSAAKALRCFRIRVVSGSTNYYSQPFTYTQNVTETSLLRYYSEKQVLGFPYDDDTYQNRIRLSLKIQKPQFPQQDEIYIDAMGVRRLLTSRVDKEYTLETDYLSVEMHEKIIVALSHNFVFINDEQLQRSGAYEIDYENELLSDCGEKLYKGTARMARNTTLLNLNC